MFIYKFLDVDNQDLISDKVYSFLQIKSNCLTAKSFWTNLTCQDLLNYVPELQIEVSKFISLPILSAAGIVVCPGFSEDPHIDFRQDMRVLWPIRNCKGSYTNFYKLTSDTKVNQRSLINGVAYYTIDKTKPLEKIAAVELTKPILFDSGIPHTVRCNKNINENRITLSLGFLVSDVTKYLLK